MSLILSIASSAVLSAVSTPMAVSVPHTSLSMVAGTPATLTPSSASLKPRSGSRSRL